mgnify:CR=1 FL=1
MADDGKSKSQDSRTQIIVAVISLLSAVGVAVVANFDKLFSFKIFPPSPSPVQTPTQLLPPSPSPAKISIKPLDKPGLYLASTTLLYSDGDQLKADFRVYCPTSSIRPTNYVLVDRTGTVKKQGAWWEQAFTPKDDSEHQLIKKVCNK